MSKVTHTYRAVTKDGMVFTRKSHRDYKVFWLVRFNPAKLGDDDMRNGWTEQGFARDQDAAEHAVKRCLPSLPRKHPYESRGEWQKRLAECEPWYRARVAAGWTIEYAPVEIDK